MLQKLRMNKKGFTLIELMIVIAIIGILAAIAIPQFVRYRIQSFNSSGLSDNRNAFTSQEAFFADWRVYGATDWCLDAAIPAWTGHAGGAAPNVLVGPQGNPAGGGNIPILTADDPQNPATARGVRIPLGNNVSLVAHTNAAAVGTIANTTFTSVAKHIQGNVYFAVDNDTTAVYFEEVPGSEGTLVVAGDCPIAVTAVDQYLGVNGPGGTPWVAR